MQASNMKQRMTNGTGVGSLLYGNSQSNHHYIDSLERFEKDFATTQKLRRQQERQRKTADLDRRRKFYSDREQKRARIIDEDFVQLQQSRDRALNQQLMRVRKRANVNSLPYNPINLEYEKTEPGRRLKSQDQDRQIRNYVRSHNIDHKGNGSYNPLTGMDRVGVQKLVPFDLGERFQARLGDHYQSYRIRLPFNIHNTMTNRV